MMRMTVCAMDVVASFFTAAGMLLRGVVVLDVGSWRVPVRPVATISRARSRPGHASATIAVIALRRCDLGFEHLPAMLVVEAMGLNGAFGGQGHRRRRRPIDMGIPGLLDRIVIGI